ncbi:hypothetical protein NL676_034332 [Syzygium grande]|nr:hypothetical protein NL676_034332 [Syzygium grande]
MADAPNKSSISNSRQPTELFSLHDKPSVSAPPPDAFDHSLFQGSAIARARASGGVAGMASFLKLFYRKPPDGLLEICERVYVFDCCFATDVWTEEDYKVHMRGMVSQFQDHFHESSILVFNFREGEERSKLNNILSEYDMTIMDYPKQYEGCPLLTMEMIHHFLRSCESWLSLGHHNLLLMHCELGGWPVLAFMLAALLIYRKLYSGEQKTLDMVYKQAPRELLHLLSPLNPVPSQQRYLQYVSRRNVATEWPPLDRALTLDCIIIRSIPNFDGEGGCRPIFRIYGQDPFLVNDRTPKALFSTSKRSKVVRVYKQAECELVKIDINCHIQGDVVLECINLFEDLEREKMMFRVMFNTAFIRSNILMLNRDEIDTLWEAKDLFPKEFRAEILFSEMDSAASVVPVDISCFEEEGLPIEAFAKVQEIFSHVEWLAPNTDAAINVIQQMKVSNIIQGKSDADSLHVPESFPLSAKKSPESIREESDEKMLESKMEKHGSVSFSLEDQSVPQKPSPERRVEATQTTKHSPGYIDSVQASNLVTTKQETTAPLGLAFESQIDDLASSERKAENATTVSSDQAVQIKSQNLSLEHLGPKSVLVSLPTPPPPPPLQPGKGGVYSSSSRATFSSSTSTSTTTTTTTTTSQLCSRATSSSPPPPSPPQPSSKTPTPPPPPMPPPPPPPPPPTPPFKEIQPANVRPPPPPPPPLHSGQAMGPKVPPTAPPAPPPSPIMAKQSGATVRNSPPVPSAPPPPVPSVKGVPKTGGGPPPGPPLSAFNTAKGRGLSRTISSKSSNMKKLKPLHWLKLSRAVQGSIWAETQKSGEATKAPEIDMSELETLFSASVPVSDHSRKKSAHGSDARKADKVQLIDHRRAYNCEIMLSKVKVPLHELMNSVLALEDSALDIDQVENLIKFCPTKEEMELLKGYTGEKEKLGRCEQFFLELMQVPRVESKLRVFSFKIQFSTQVADLRNNLNIVNSSAEEIKNSAKLKRIMQTILSLGNALNQGTARGSAIGFRLDSLLKLTETRARNNKMTLMHYLCKVLADKLPEVLDFSKDLAHLEPASKIQVKFLAEEMQAISKGLEKVMQELSVSENDGPVSETFCKTLKEFLRSAEAEVRSLALLYSGVGRNVDSLILYFGEDPARCPFEQVVSTLLNFVRMFNKAHEENCKQKELEMKKAAETDKAKLGDSHKKADHQLQTSLLTSNVL